MNITYTPTYPILRGNSDTTYLVTYSVLITIRIYRFIPLPEDFCGVDKSCASYLYQKRGVYYFSKQVACDVRQHYKRDRIVLCLKTKSINLAKRMFDSILQRLCDYWLLLILSTIPLPAAHSVPDSNVHGQLTIVATLLEARDAYLRLMVA